MLSVKDCVHTDCCKNTSLGNDLHLKKKKKTCHSVDPLTHALCFKNKCQCAAGKASADNTGDSVQGSQSAAHYQHSGQSTKRQCDQSIDMSDTHKTDTSLMHMSGSAAVSLEVFTWPQWSAGRLSAGTAPGCNSSLHIWFHILDRVEHKPHCTESPAHHYQEHTVAIRQSAIPDYFNETQVVHRYRVFSHKHPVIHLLGCSQ